jgi:branched-chain amino acid transport system substrate-binding protein
MTTPQRHVNWVVRPHEAGFCLDPAEPLSSVNRQQFAFVFGAEGFRSAHPLRRTSEIKNEPTNWEDALNLSAGKIAVIGGVLAATSAAARAEDVKIGVLATLSGPATSWGLALQSAAEFAAEDVNKSGGLEAAGKKYTVRVVSYDDKYKPNDAVTGANRLIYEDKVAFIVGPMGSAPALAVLPITTENSIISMTMAFTPTALDNKYKFSFRPVISTAEFSVPQIKWIASKLSLKKVGGLFPNDESGQQVAVANGTAYGAVGVAFVKEFFERDRLDFVPLLTRLLSQQIDGFELDGNSPQTAGLMTEQIRELGFTGPIIRTGGDATAEILEVAGKEAAEGMYLHQAIDPTSPQIEAYRKRYETKYRGAMNALAPFFYVNVQMTFAAMQKAGTVIDSAKIRDALESIKNFDSIVGEVSWAGQGSYGVPHQLSAPFYIAQIRKGVPVIIAHCTTAGCE